MNCTVKHAFLPGVPAPPVFFSHPSRVHQTIKTILSFSVFYISLNLGKEYSSSTPQSVGLLSDSEARVSSWQCTCLNSYIGSSAGN